MSDYIQAIARSVEIARGAGRDFPLMRDIDEAAYELGVEFEPVAAGLGYLPALPDSEIERRGLPYQRSFWINTREVYPDDDRVAVLVNADTVHMFSRFLRITGLQPQPLVLVKNEAAAGGDRASVDAAHSPNGG